MSDFLKNNLKFLRKKFKYTQSDISSKLNISRSTFSNYEQGQSEPDIETVINICKIFNCSIDEFLTVDLSIGDTLKNINVDNYNNIFSSNLSSKTSYHEDLESIKNKYLEDLTKLDSDYKNYRKFLNYKISSISKIIDDIKINDTNIEFSNEIAPVNINNSNQNYEKTEIDDTQKNDFNLDYIFKSINNIDNYIKPRFRNMRKNQLLNLSIIDFNEIEYTEIPIISEISAGLPSLSYQNLDYNYSLKIPNDYINDNYEYFVLKVKGDSMNEIYKNKELLLIRSCSYVENGEIAVVSIDKDTATLKEYYFNSEENTVYLIPHSSFEDYKTQPYNINEHSINILGKVEKILKI